ncbi:16S rRNA (guanine1207-N2)-methyltransferase [Alicyclobacillus hesperidum]|uniref:16S rRNA (Guanine1207-N2)-methyltransferase n=1 Tax=Alicyclobacillus hesperidum TaxID=89784 RepID=A0A1H2VIE5_9BACL|nr:methyltransferase [Alicyclobacillus hesperidum]SDW68101.1 16S rRNA (guanine1207-N2)-methyltransferase [Alicyclobacillus hesperidum]
MTDHYYSQRPSVASDERKIHIDVRGVSIDLVTDRGVFAKGGLDEATRRLIETVDLAGATEALDLGTGYGVVTAVLGRVYPGIQWTLIDINERAIDLAVRNTVGLLRKPVALVNDGIPDDMEAVFDHVLLNPPIRAGKLVMYRLYEQSKRALRKRGKLWVVIQKKHGAPSTLEELRRRFGVVEIVYKKSGYFIFCAEKD